MTSYYCRILYLCRPRVIVGLLLHFSYNFPIKKIIGSLLLFLMASSASIMFHPRTSITSPSMDWIYPLVQSTVLSPFTLGIVFVESKVSAVAVAKSIFHSLTNVYPTLQKEMTAYPSVLTYLQKGVTEGRVERTSLYDLYLPPHPNVLLSQSNSLPHDQDTPCIIFLPGMLVDHAAYANVGRILSNNGVIVAVVCAEPLRMPARFLGASSTDIFKIMESVKKKLHFEHKKISIGKKKIQWIIGGHSMGAYTAMSLAKTLKFSKLIIWGAGNIEERVPNLRNNCPSSASDSDIQVLSISASNDSIAGFHDDNSLLKFQSKMPEDTVYTSIQGGNHAGFACYPTNRFDNTNKREIISWESQQHQACTATLQFIFNKHSYSL